MSSGDRDDLFLARLKAAEAPAGKTGPVTVLEASVLEMFDATLEFCVALAKRDAWPGANFSKKLETILRKHVGPCGHVGHNRGCQCENDE